MASNNEDIRGVFAPGARITVFGAGRMGLPISGNLKAAGYDVVVTDIRSEVAEAVMAQGARWEPVAAAAVTGADIVITVLPGVPEILELTAGDGPLLPALGAHTTWVDLTTSSPLVMKPIQDEALARGVEVLEAPMGGGPGAAQAGTLQLFAGGDATTFCRVLPVLEAVADPSRIKLVGGRGLGYTAKLLVNLLWFGQAVATAEAMHLGQAAGFDAEALRTLLADSAAGSEFLRHDVQRVFSGDYMPLFGLDRCTEELETVTDMFQALGVPSELSQIVTRIHQRALSRFGPVDGELMALALMEELAGSRLRPR